MRMIFIDAENIGLKYIEQLDATILDKVFVFSKSDAIKLACEKYLYLYLSDYPNGQNQADFYIIAYLSRILTAIDKKQLSTVQFGLYSNDENLIAAFNFQCAQLGAQCQVIRTKQDTVVPMQPQSKTLTPSAEEKLYKALSQPKALDPSLQSQLGLSKSDFTKAINELTKKKRIQRTPESKKMWVQC